jgi:hypothetical protein
MNPRGILTSLRKQRGKVVHRTVYNGALFVEDGAHAVMRVVLADYLLGNVAMATATSKGGRNAATARTAMAMLSQKGFCQWFNMATTAGDGQ